MVEELKLEVASLRKEVAELRDMVAKLSVVPKPAPKVAAPKKEEGVDETTMMIISAAVAAFLGKRATIKFVRPVKSAAVDGWRLQGRVAIHGSHVVR